MKFLFSTLIVLFISSCKKDDSKNIEKRDFIVSKFNDDIEKHFQEAKLKNPDLALIKEIKFYDYPKGAVNFIFLKDNSVYYYNEQLFSLICGTGLEKLKPTKRVLSSDSLKIIKYSEIYNLLKTKAAEEKMKDGRQNLRHLSFAFENDTIKNYNISKLLQDIDSLGYHSYTVRRMAQFEGNALRKRDK
ncbi:hypothetical protein [Chryseobacterium scophthalmum]|uniref:Lipoprotein n=1 Tax=Chryseobacterium scophthalmum TaxID=59733 RepID=A0A1N6EPZ9_9FLAO|nr:hypothetical protein [Chryseobacterium scophthalmum]SIN85021.1 hypothetical protein SAMN05421769_0577 [Chryseobacterium scophthalmum]